LIKAIFGEFLATFLFIFVVLATHVNVVRSTSGAVGSSISLLLGGISTGFTAVAIIYSFADVSGAHFNPAVTFGTMVMGKTSWGKVTNLITYNARVLATLLPNLLVLSLLLFGSLHAFQKKDLACSVTLLSNSALATAMSALEMLS
jgi:aquaporin related protein